MTAKLRLHSQWKPAAAPIGDWQTHCIGHMHEPEGGEDTTGGIVRVGVEEMKKYMKSLYDMRGSPEAWDDMSVMFLNPSKVKEVQAEEVRFSKHLGVYERVPRSMVKELNRKMVSVKWLGTSKGRRQIRTTDLGWSSASPTPARKTRCMHLLRLLRH